MNSETFSIPSGQKYSNDNTGSLSSRGVLHSHMMNGSFPVVVMLRLPSCLTNETWLVRSGLSGNVIDLGWSAFKTFRRQKLCCAKMQNSTAKQFAIATDFFGYVVRVAVVRLYSCIEKTNGDQWANEKAGTSSSGA